MWKIELIVRGDWKGLYRVTYNGRFVHAFATLNTAHAFIDRMLLDE